MKSAKEMFEELGYVFEINDNFIEYYKNSKKSFFVYKHVCFDLVNKSYSASCNYENMEIDMTTFSAIYQQVKELGWLEE